MHVPPLRERAADLEPLARHFLRKFALQMGKGLRDFEPQALAAILAYSWPGNVRELENAVERAVAVSGEQESLVRLESLPETVSAPSGGPAKSEPLPEDGLDFERRMAEVEKAYLLRALKAAEGVRTRAAELLHISYRSFRHYAKKHGV